MPWHSLGVIQLSENWQSFSEPAVDTEVFKIIHLTQIPSFQSCYLGQHFPSPQPGGILTPWRKIFPSAEPQIVNLPLPAGYREANYFLFEIFIKRKLPYYPLPWSIEIQALV